MPVIRMKEYNLNLGVIPFGGGKDFSFDLVEWDDPVTSVSSLSDSFSVELVDQAKIGENIQVRCRVTLKNKAIGLVQFQIELKSGDKTQKMWAYGLVLDAAGTPAAAPKSSAAAR